MWDLEKMQNDIEQFRDDYTLYETRDRSETHDR